MTTERQLFVKSDVYPLASGGYDWSAVVPELLFISSGHEDTIAACYEAMNAEVERQAAAMFSEPATSRLMVHREQKTRRGPMEIVKVECQEVPRR